MKPLRKRLYFQRGEVGPLEWFFMRPALDGGKNFIILPLNSLQEFNVMNSLRKRPYF